MSDSYLKENEKSAVCNSERKHNTTEFGKPEKAPLPNQLCLIHVCYTAAVLLLGSKNRFLWNSWLNWHFHLALNYEERIVYLKLLM